MNKLSFKLFALTMTALAGLATGQNGGDTATLNQISSYRQWTKVNAEPVKVEIPLKIDPALAGSGGCRRDMAESERGRARLREMATWTSDQIFGAF